MAYAFRSDSAKYQCGVFPYIYSDSIIYIVDTVTVTVTDREFSFMKPRKEYAPSVVKATFGMSAILECFFSGYQEPVITWKDKQQQIIQEGHGHYVIDDFGRKLRIEQVREEDEGTYSCTARNGAGSDDAKIFLNVTSPPLMLTTPDTSLEKLYKLSGQMATLKCWARAMEGENLEPPVWYRNGELLTIDNFPDKTRYSFGECGTELTIRNLNKSTDTACFQCNISNSEGYIFFDGFLKVVDWDEIEF
ncbi:hemicentin-2-like [Physella acuta]|uniref:hemicentin-2-like n=1 Tax=Physella acuta TaxID=109671 RepID=UPI0027DAB6CE|nr:hemicentin-2-like [Physella acuta]